MDIRLNNLKQDFTQIVDLKNENLKTFSMLLEKIKKLKEYYADFIKNNKQNLFMFGLDSFHFQGKLIDIEYDDMQRLFNAITNRIYCEYYKLCKIIVEYIQTNINEKKILELTQMNFNFPVYKDLEPFKKYDFDHVINLHEHILVLLNAMHGYLLHKEHELRIHQMKNNIGLNIDNFVFTFQYNNMMTQQKLVLYITYIEYFHKLHTKYLKRFTTKLQLMFSQITNDIKFEDSEQMNKTRRKSMMETLQGDNLDIHLMSDLKNSMGTMDGDSVNILPSVNNAEDDDKYFTDDIPKPTISIMEGEQHTSLASVFLNIQDTDMPFSTKNVDLDQNEVKESLNKNNISEITQKETEFVVEEPAVNSGETSVSEKEKEKEKEKEQELKTTAESVSETIVSINVDLDSDPDLDPNPELSKESVVSTNANANANVDEGKKPKPPETVKSNIFETEYNPNPNDNCGTDIDKPENNAIEQVENNLSTPIQVLLTEKPPISTPKKAQEPVAKKPSDSKSKKTTEKSQKKAPHADKKHKPTPDPKENVAGGL